MTNVQRSRRQVRLSRALGIALTPKAQRIFEKRPYAPGEHGRTRRRTESDYAVRLREKQRLRAQYGISEKQLRAAYEKGTHTAGQTGNAMLTDLETRLDALVLRAASPAPPPSSPVRGPSPHPRRCNIVDRPSYRVKPGQTIQSRPRARPWFRSSRCRRCAPRCAAGGSGLPGRQPAFLKATLPASLKPRRSRCRSTSSVVEFYAPLIWITIL